MPRTIHPDLLDCLRRPNPYVEYRVEVTEPDAVRIIRRTDEFLGNPPLVPPMVPANSLSTDARGSLILSPGVGQLAGAPNENSFYDLNGEDPQRRIKGLGWTMDAAFSRATLKSFLARVQRAGIFNFDLDFELQIFRVTKTPGFKERFVAGTQQVQATAFTDYSFSPLLNPAPVIKAGAIAWDGARKATLNFDLSNYALILENTPSRAASPDQVGELPKYYFVVRVLNNPAGTGHFRWLVDNTSGRVVAGVGTFNRVFWARENDQQQWAENVIADMPCFTLNVETYPASGRAVYAIDVGKLPDGARGSLGRTVFERFLPPGTDATYELSTDGGGAYSQALHGAAVLLQQQYYHVRVTLYSDATGRATPQVAALGVEFRIPVDVSVESTPQLPTREIALPWPKASIPEGKLVIARTGVRDYLDTAGIIGSTQPTTKLECDIYLASRHPGMTRDKWLHLERLNVTNRIPGATSESLTLLSYAAKLKRKLPQKMESLSTVHTVTASTVNDVTVAPALVGATAGGNEYDAQGYYMRVRSTSNPDVKPGSVHVISGNTGVNRLDFVPPLTVALAIGDVVEVHSGRFATQPISWTDADPADVWYQLLTTYAGIPPERIGLGTLPRGGKPPRVTDIAPGDAVTQAKLKITNKISEIESADELLDQVSAIVGGVTLEMPGGQICFVQIFPLRDALGNVTVPLPPIIKTFDQRDYGASLQTPPGLEKRATVMSASYGVPLTAAAPETYPKQTTVTVDNDALLWLTQQDLEDFGSAEIPDKIARWLYNTADSGLYLASSLTATYVRALSTGLRVFPFGSTERNPELMPGDSVAVVTDQYTDYEPSSRTPLRGPLVVRGVLVSVGNEGKQLALFVPGLMDNVTSAVGGAAGELTGLGPPLDPPILSGSFSPDGELIVTSQGAVGTAIQRIAVGDVEPSDAFTRASTPIYLQNISAVASGLIVSAGASAWIKAFAYNAYGRESLVAKIQLTREGSGTADPPTAFIVPLDTEIDDTIWYLGFEVVAGSGGGGANLTYEVRQKISYQPETVIDSGDENDLPVILGIARHPKSDKAIRFVVMDAATGMEGVERINIPASRPEVDDTGLQFTSGVKESGGRVVNRLLAKPLAADPDNFDSVSEGTSYKRPAAAFVDVNGGIKRLQNYDTRGDNFGPNGYPLGLTSEFKDGSVVGVPGHPGSTFGTVLTEISYPDGTAGNAAKQTFHSAYDNQQWRRFGVPNAATWAGAWRIVTESTNQRFGRDTGHLLSDMQESGGKTANRLLAKALAADVDNADSVLGGTIRRVPLVGAMDGSGNIDLAGSAWLNRAGNYIARNTGDSTPYSTIVSNLSNVGDLAAGMLESGGKATNRLYAKPLAADPDNLDSVGNGTSYSRPLASRISAGKPFIDFSEAFNLNKTLAYVADTPSRFAAPVPNATSDVTLIASAGVVLGGNYAIRSFTPAWDEQVYSKEGYTGGAYAQAVCGSLAGYDVMFGLNTDPTSSADYNSIDYAMYHNSAGALYAYESGVSTALGSAVAGGILAVVYDGSFVRWMQNGIVLRTVAAPAGLTLYFDSSIYFAELKNIRFGPMSSNNAAAIGAGNLASGINESGAKPINRLLAKTLAADPDNSDSVLAGAIRRIPLLGASDASGNINFAGSAWVNRAGNYLQRNTGDSTPYSTIVANLSNVGDLGAGMLESGGKATNRLYAKSLAADPDTYDSVAEGTSYKRVAASQMGGSLVVKLGSVDVRSTNEPPSFYQMGQTVEFKTRSVIGAPGSVTFGQLTTDKPWTDSSGGDATQTFRSADGAFKREGPGGGATWGSWRYIIEATSQRIVRDTGHLGSDMNESGGAAVNRLLAKPLAADPNTYDSVADGVTYKRILGVSSGQVGTTGMQDASVTPVKALPRMRCKVYHSGSQSIANNTNVVVGWDAESWDSGTLHDNSTNNSRITVPAGGNTGVWHLRAQICWAASTPGTGVRRTIIKKNGTTWLANTQYAAIPGGALITIVECNADDDTPAVGDYYEVEVVQNSGAALNLLGSGSPDNSQFTALHMW